MSVPEALDDALLNRRFQSLLRLLEITRLLADEIDADKIMEVVRQEAARRMMSLSKVTTTER